LGGESRFVPLVVGPSAVPEVRELNQALANPELAVLSAMAHGRSEDTTKAVEIATVAAEASRVLEADRSVMYFDLVYASMSDAARKSFLTMDPAKYEFQSEFAKRYVAQGELLGEQRGEHRGEQRGRAQTLISLLNIKFGPLDSGTVSRVEGATIEELKLWAERVLEAKSLEDVLL